MSLNYKPFKDTQFENNTYQQRKPYYKKQYNNYGSKRMRKMDFVKFVDMSTMPAKTFEHYGTFIVPQIGDKIIENETVYVVVDRHFNYDDECIIVTVEGV